MPNKLLDTETHLQVAASPLGVRSGQLRRYPSSLAPTADRPHER